MGVSKMSAAVRLYCSSSLMITHSRQTPAPPTRHPVSSLLQVHLCSATADRTMRTDACHAACRHMNMHIPQGGRPGSPRTPEALSCSSDDSELEPMSAAAHSRVPCADITTRGHSATCSPPQARWVPKYSSRRRGGLSSGWVWSFVCGHGILPGRSSGSRSRPSTRNSDARCCNPGWQRLTICGAINC